MLVIILSLGVIRSNKFSGRIRQDIFKSKVIVKDKYLVDCINYIELKPVRANMTKAPTKYKWSSYKERILSQSTKGKILNEIYLEA